MAPHSAKQAFIAAIVVIVLGVVVAVLMTRAQMNPTIQTIGTVVTVAVLWGGFMGWMLRRSVDASKVERVRFILRGANDAEMDAINASIRREWSN